MTVHGPVADFRREFTLLEHEASALRRSGLQDQEAHALVVASVAEAEKASRKLLGTLVAAKHAGKATKQQKQAIEEAVQSLDHVHAQLEETLQHIAEEERERRSLRATIIHNLLLADEARQHLERPAVKKLLKHK